YEALEQRDDWNVVCPGFDGVAVDPLAFVRRQLARAARKQFVDLGIRVARVVLANVPILGSRNAAGVVERARVRIWAGEPRVHPELVITLSQRSLLAEKRRSWHELQLQVHANKLQVGLDHLGGVLAQRGVGG